MTPLLTKVLSKLAAKRLLDGLPIPENPCPSMTGLAAYLDGRLPVRERREIEGHLAGCAGCRAAVIELRNILGTLATEPSEVPAEVLLAAKNIVTRQCAKQTCVR